jgi:hypothetical protein
MKWSKAPWTVWLRFTHQRSAVRYRPRPPTLTEVKGPPDDRPPDIQSGTTTVHFAPGFDDVLVTLRALVAVLASAATRRGGHARSRSAPAGSARCSS